MVDAKVDLTAFRYPLFCIDTGRDDEQQYFGPYETEAEAKAVLVKGAPDLWRPDAEPRIRRCRRSKVFIPDQFDWIEDAIGEAAGENPPTVTAWANWEEELVEFKEGASAALAKLLEKWAAEYAFSKIYEVAPDE